MRLAIALALFCACGRVDFDAIGEPTNGNQSGTRLKLQWYDFDGTRYPRAELFDALRGEECKPLPWDDGQEYCTPESIRGIAFADAACTQAIVVAGNAACGLPPYVTESIPAPCTGVATFTHIYEVGPALPAVTSFWTGPPCNGPYSSTSIVAFQRGAEITRTDLVAMPTSAPTGGGRLQTIYWTSDDGLRARRDTYDTALGIACNPSEQACLPRQPASIVEYLDAQCTMPFATEPSVCPVAPVSSIPTACASAPGTYYQTGQPITPPAAYALIPTCTMASLPANGSFFGVGPQVTAASLAREVEAIPSRRIRRADLVGDGAPIPDTLLEDTQLGLQCTPELADDNAYRCVPAGDQIGEFFSDPQCTQKIYLDAMGMQPNNCSMVPTPYGRSLADPTAPCRSGYRGHARVSAQRYTAPFYVPGNGCTLVDTPSIAYYEFGPPIEASTLAPATLVHDP